MAQQQLNDQMLQNPPLMPENNNPQNNYQPEPQEIPQAEPQPAPFNPTSAISAADKQLLANCRQKLMNITLESCNFCHEKWFDLDVENGKCKGCRKSTKYQASNKMYPGVVFAHLPELTQMEEIIISPVHALVQLWQVRGGQTKYTGHTCNFPRENAVFYTKVPLLPEECDFIIMCHTTANAEDNDRVFQDFWVCRHAIQ